MLISTKDRNRSFECEYGGTRYKVGYAPVDLNDEAANHLLRTFPSYLVVGPKSVDPDEDDEEGNYGQEQEESDSPDDSRPEAEGQGEEGQETIGPVGAVCGACGKSFATDAALKRHITMNHK